MWDNANKHNPSIKEIRGATKTNVNCITYSFKRIQYDEEYLVFSFTITQQFWTASIHEIMLDIIKVFMMDLLNYYFIRIWMKRSNSRYSYLLLEYNINRFLIMSLLPTFDRKLTADEGRQKYHIYDIFPIIWCEQDQIIQSNISQLFVGETSM